MCDDCRRVEAKDTWNANVQVRQKGGQRKTLFYLEQLLIKYEATRECSAIQPNAEGLDFFFGSESGARDGRGSACLPFSAKISLHVPSPRSCFYLHNLVDDKKLQI